MSLLEHPGLRHLTPTTPSRPNHADGVAKVARALYQAELMPWQRHVATLETELLPSGFWAYRTIIVTVPRQAGKTMLRGPLIIHRCLTKPFARCQFTAQTRQDARDIVIDEVASRFTRSPLAPTGKVRRSQGSEGINFERSTGSIYRVFPPTEGGLDGKANERVDVDEGWRLDALTGAALDNSIQPTFTTTGGQFGLVSTAGTSDSTWLLGYINQGRAAVLAGQTEGVALVEFGVPQDVADYVRELLAAGAWGPKFEEAVQLLAIHNPAHGYTLRVDALASGVRAMLANPEAGGVDGVLRAYGNHWTRSAVTLIPAHAWEAVTVDPGPAPARVALGVAAGIGAQDAALAIAWRDHTGRPRGRIIDHRPGVTWAPAALAAAANGLGIPPACAGAGPVLEVVDSAERHHRPLEVTRLAGPDYGTSCAQLLTLILAGVPHFAQHDALDDAAGAATKRRVNDGGWAWDRTGSAGSIAALEAMTVALWQWDHAPAELEGPGVYTKA